MIWGTFIFYCSFIMYDIHPYYKSGLYHVMQYRQEEIISIPESSLLEINVSCPELY